MLLVDDPSSWEGVAERLRDRHDVAVVTEPPTTGGPVHLVAHGRRSVAVAARARDVVSLTVVSGRRPASDVPVQWIRPVRRRAVLPTPFDGAGRQWRRSVVAGADVPRSHAAVLARMVGEFVDEVNGDAVSPELRRAAVGAKLVLVTGAGSGIGRATALAYAADGADVLVADLDLAAAEGTAELARAHGVTAAAYRVDVSDSAAVDEVAARVVAEHGVPDVVMANAGIAVIGGFLAVTEQEWRRVVGVNLWGVINTFRAFVPHLVERGSGGHLLVTSSMASFFHTRGQSAYATTKAGAVTLARSLCAELSGHGIGVTAIVPGFVRTNIAASARFAGADETEEARRRDEAVQIAGKRAAPPEQVAATVLRAVSRNRFFVPATREARLLAALNRVAPGLLFAIARRMDLG